jgi:aerobic-type carbon monoxide dehydrogenase small subunit (CoxS/CutS family)
MTIAGSKGDHAMANKEDPSKRETHVSRREFIKDAGAMLTGTVLASAVTVPREAVEAATPNVKLEFRCPLDEQTFDTFANLKEHFGSAHPVAVIPQVTILKVNGKNYEVQIEPHWTLQRTLQFKLGLTGAKTMCDRGECGSCAVLVDGKAVLSCTTLSVECEAKSIETIEGIAADPKWNPLIQAYLKHDAMQCGYCTPGFIVTAKAMLTKNPNPTEGEIQQALAGNICRCGTYPRHPKAILEAAQVLRGGK